MACSCCSLMSLFTVYDGHSVNLVTELHEIRTAGLGYRFSMKTRFS
jgi:hypothetical protein